MGQQKSSLFSSGQALDDVFSQAELARQHISRSPADQDDVPSANVKSLFEDHRSIRRNDGEQNSNGNDEPVEEALALFDQLSSQLTRSYRSLENKVSQLKDELSAEELQRREELKEKEQLASRLTTLLDLLPAGVVLLDGNGIVIESNPAALELLGEPLDGEAWVDVIRRCFAPRHDDGHEVSLKDGRRVRIEIRSMPDAPGQLILLSDLTETRLLQEQVSRTERLSSLGKMVASLAHQIRTPLSTAMLYAGHLSQPRLGDDMRIECAKKLQSRLTHLEHQIRDMLIFAKGDTRLAEQLPVIELVESLKQAAEPLLLRAEASFEWNYDVGALDILCNREALVGACINLINNSIEAVDQHKDDLPQLKLSINICQKNATSLMIQISDNGPGIPSAQKQKVMEPFYTTKPQGTGLGLAVVKAVIKAHKGELNLSSSKQGVVATIELPIYQSQIPSNNAIKSNNRKNR